MTTAAETVGSAVTDAVGAAAETVGEAATGAMGAAGEAVSPPGATEGSKQTFLQAIINDDMSSLESMGVTQEELDAYANKGVVPARFR